MQHIVSRLQEIVQDYAPLLKQLPASKFADKPLPGKWSKKETLGHLIDSAQNNIRRFIVAQYEESPVITYAQDSWVAISNYQQYNTNDLVDLWILINKHAMAILASPIFDPTKTCITGEPHNLEWIAEDYIKHLLHHLHQVLDLEPIAYP